MTLRSLLVTLLALGAGCPSPSHPAPVFEADPSAPAPSTGREEPPPEPAAERRGVARPFLYAVRNTEQPSYLLGTTHVGVSLEEALPGHWFEEALAAPRVVVVEIDPATVSPQDLANAARVPRRAPTLDQRLPSLLWHDLAEELSGVMASEGLRQMRPWFAAMLLMQTRALELHDGRLPEAMDLSVVRYAREQGIEVVPLEQVRDQVAVFDRIPDEQVLAELAEMLEDREANLQELAQLLEAYRRGDEDRLAQLVFDPAEVEARPEFFEHLFTRRNAAWLPRLERELEAGGAFVAVGVGHLIGEQGLVAQLRERGFPVERVQ